MKFFSKYIMTKEHINALRESRKIYVNDKIIDYGQNFVEHYNFEKGVWVYPKNDSLLEEIENIKIYDEPYYDERYKRYVNYDYYSLSHNLRVYMQKKDADFFNKWYRKHKLKDVLPVHEIDYILKKVEDEKGQLTNEDINAILTGNIETQKASTYKKAVFSARRAYQNVIGLIRTNLDKFNAFITLTFARKENIEKYKKYDASFDYVENASDFKEVKEKFSRFVNTLSKNMKRRGLEFHYVAVWELHHDRTYHFHMICSELPKDLINDAPDWLDYDYKKRKKRNGKMVVHWKHGKSDYEKIEDKERMSTYISKYILKTLSNVNEDDYETYLNCKKYFTSKGLEKPKINYIVEEKEIEQFMKKTKGYAEAYPVIYKNVYNGGKILKTIYSRNEKKITC